MPENETYRLIPPRERDLGGFVVRRILPVAFKKTVGPFIFFDHMGPKTFAPGEGMDVRPHPHIGLATVTFLFEGAIMHRDSLGSEQIIRPGDINWMTAGSGIVHSERTPAELRQIGSQIEGIQCWVALPREQEEAQPSFIHYSSQILPEFRVGGAKIRLLVGSVFGHKSPVQTYVETLYLDVALEESEKLNIPAESRELGAYVVSGRIKVMNEAVQPGFLFAQQKDHDLLIEAEAPSRVMIIGGAPLPEKRHIWWNFVSSSKARIEQAKSDWAQGRFPLVPGDEHEFIPLPEDRQPLKPEGTIM